MKKLINLLFCLFSILFCHEMVIAQKKKETANIRIATYNIRREGDETEEKHKWPHRRGLVISLIKKIQPDILGLQEPIEKQIEDLSKELPEYAWIGESRGSYIKGLSLWHRIGMLFGKDEFNPLFYRTKRVTLLDHETFGINVGYLPNQTGWLPRVCTWGLFEHKETGKKFYVYNTHLDHMYEEARKEGINTIMDDIKKRVGEKKYPVILMGDFNAEYSELKDSIEKAGFAHAKDKAEEKLGPEYTSTGWQEELKTIDHILVKLLPKIKMIVKKFIVVETPGTYPSDHRPVYVDLQFK